MITLLFLPILILSQRDLLNEVHTSIFGSLNELFLQMRSQDATLNQIFRGSSSNTKIYVYSLTATGMPQRFIGAEVEDNENQEFVVSQSLNKVLNYLQIPRNAFQIQQSYMNLAPLLESNCQCSLNTPQNRPQNRPDTIRVNALPIVVSSIPSNQLDMTSNPTTSVRNPPSYTLQNQPIQRPRQVQQVQPNPPRQSSIIRNPFNNPRLVNQTQQDFIPSNTRVTYDGEDYTCNDFRLPTLSKTSFYKAIDNKGKYNSIFTVEELNKQLEDIWNQCFGTLQQIQPVDNSNRPSDINNNQLTEQLNRVSQNNTDLDNLSRLPIQTQNSTIIIDTTGPSDPNRSNVTTTVTVSSRNVTNETNNTDPSRLNQTSSISSNNTHVNTTYTITNTTTTRNITRSNNTTTNPNSIDFAQLDLNLDNLTSFFDVLENNADKFQQFDLSGLVNSQNKTDSGIVQELQNLKDPEVTTTVVTRETQSSYNSTNGQPGQNRTTSSYNVRTLQGQDAQNVSSEIQNLQNAIQNNDQEGINRSLSNVQTIQSSNSSSSNSSQSNSSQSSSSQLTSGSSQILGSSNQSAGNQQMNSGQSQTTGQIPLGNGTTRTSYTFSSTGQPSGNLQGAQSSGGISRSSTSTTTYSSSSSTTGNQQIYKENQIIFSVP